MNRIIPVLTVLAMSGISIGAQTPALEDDVVKKIISVGTTDNKVMDHLDILLNRFGGRLVGSDAYENAADWMIREYGKWGIKAWKEEAGKVPVGFNRGPWFGRLLGADEPMSLHFATPSYTSGTKGVQRGHVVMEPMSRARLNRMKHKLKGAWVLLNGTSVNGWPIDKSAKGDSIRQAVIKENEVIAKKNDSLMMENWTKGTKHEMLPYKEHPGIFYKEMVDAGVLGFIQRAKVPIRALYDRPLVNDSTTCFDSLPHQAEILLDEHQYDKIARMVKERRDIELEFDIRNHFKLGPVTYHSVIAEIPGTEFPDEYVIVSGHLDAYDVATGGIDCGTGIGPMMETARLLALSGAKPRRTIRFVAFAAEEFGLLGAKAYARKHKDELSKISMLFNRDGGPTPPVGMRVPAAMKEDIEKATEPIKYINKEYPFEVTVSPPRRKPTAPSSSDETVFACEGVPTQGFVTSDFKGYDFDYGEIWHTERDVYNKHIPEYQEHTAVATALAAYGIANLDHLLSREGMYKEAEKTPAGKKTKKKSAKK